MLLQAISASKLQVSAPFLGYRRVFLVSNRPIPSYQLHREPLLWNQGVYLETFRNNVHYNAYLNYVLCCHFRELHGNMLTSVPDLPGLNSVPLL